MPCIQALPRQLCNDWLYIMVMCWSSLKINLKINLNNWWCIFNHEGYKTQIHIHLFFKTNSGCKGLTKLIEFFRSLAEVWSPDSNFTASVQLCFVTQTARQALISCGQCQSQMIWSCWHQDMEMLSALVVLCRGTWWRHQMETFSALLALCAGTSPVPMNSPHKGQWHGALMFSLIYAWINGWVTNC